jgi:phosphoglucomutase
LAAKSAGASFLRRNGESWTTDKDGLILGLLAAEITAVTGRDPGVYYASLTAQFGQCFYSRIDTPATPEQKHRLAKLDPSSLSQTHLAGDPIEAKLTKAPGNGASIGGLKVTTANGWFAARPSGTENICKLYAESMQSESHLQRIIAEAQEIL